jgi:hypothetical protein
LNDGSIGHRRILHRHEPRQLAAADDETARMLREMTREIEQLRSQPPPGNSADKAGYPVSTTRVRPRASCEARQSDG